MTGDSSTQEKRKEKWSFRHLQSIIITALCFVVGYQFYIIHQHAGSIGVIEGSHHRLEKPKRLSENEINKATEDKEKNDNNPNTATVDEKSQSKLIVDSTTDKTKEINFFKDLLQLANGVTADEETLKSLPLYSDFTDLYGDKPVIVGLDTCKTYRETVPAENRMIGPAGIFNTGTNLFAQLLERNCKIPGRKGGSGMRWQVPWGKHTPESWRLHNVAQAGGKGVIQEDVLPVVTIKDPYSWMTSMCRHSYSANWRHSEEHCPNLLPNEIDKSHNWFKQLSDGEPIPVNIRYNKESRTAHKSLAHLWNDYYGAYDNVTAYPRLIVRFEDFLIYPKEVVTEVCECAGGVIKDSDKFQVIAASAKGSNGPHSGAQGLIASIQRYGDAQIRRAAYTDAKDVNFAKESLDPELMKKYQYTHLV